MVGVEAWLFLFRPFAPGPTDQVPGKARIAFSASSRYLVKSFDEMKRKPAEHPVECLISRLAYKRDVHYLLNAAELDALRASLLDLKLARYRYTTHADDARSRLGFLVDQAPQSPAVASDPMPVDLYTYATMIAAAVQAQQKKIDALRGEVHALCHEQAR